jgi:hypothetical protein
MEYLMTYGWAILIIAVVLASMWQLGVFNSASQAPRAQPGSCRAARQQAFGSGLQVGLVGECNGELPEFVAQFDGLSSQINLGNSVSLAPGSITIEMWMETPSSAGMSLVDKAATYSPPNNYGYGLNINAGGAGIAGFEFGMTQSTWVNAFGTGVVPVNDGRWHQIILTYSSGTGSIYLYIDGKQDKLYGVGPGPAIGAGPDDLLIGSGIHGYFKGDISNVQLYNTSVSAAEVQALYAEGIGGAPLPLPNLVGWWPLNGDINDYSGSNNGGIPTNIAVNGTWTGAYTAP